MLYFKLHTEDGYFAVIGVNSDGAGVVDNIGAIYSEGGHKHAVTQIEQLPNFDGRWYGWEATKCLAD